MAEAILSLNAGSSGIKFALFGLGQSGRAEHIARGAAELSASSPRLFIRDAAGATLFEQLWTSPPDYEALLEQVVGWAENHLGNRQLAAVGHRIVHGGSEQAAPELVTPELLSVLDALTPLAPLHEQRNIVPVRIIGALRPKLPQVVCFDTAFHRTMPAVARRFGLPRDLEQEGIRRYGFHGLSYEYVSGRLREIVPRLAAGRTIVAHLGSGASLCALHGGRSVDTTMGFSALDGLVMGTRCGALDPGVVLYLQKEHGMSAAEIEDLLYRRSGLLGVSGGIASDMRTLLASKDSRAKEAVELFVFRVAREIGALAASLGGVDGLVFTAGIGEHAPAIRAAVCERLHWLGARIDAAANAENVGSIASGDSRMELRVIPTDEEEMIACHTQPLLPGKTAGI